MNQELEIAKLKHEIRNLKFDIERKDMKIKYLETDVFFLKKAIPFFKSFSQHIHMKGKEIMPEIMPEPGALF